MLIKSYYILQMVCKHSSQVSVSYAAKIHIHPLYGCSRNWSKTNNNSYYYWNRLMTSLQMSKSIKLCVVPLLNCIQIILVIPGTRPFDPKMGTPWSDDLACDAYSFGVDWQTS